MDGRSAANSSHLAARWRRETNTLETTGEIIGRRLPPRPAVRKEPLDATGTRCYLQRLNFMDIDAKYALMPVGEVTPPSGPVLDPSASPFKVVVDPQMRSALKKALFDLIDHHDEALAEYVAQGKLSLESYKEYIELFARALRETMDSPEGVLYLLRAAGLEGVTSKSVNLAPEWRWK